MRKTIVILLLLMYCFSLGCFGKSKLEYYPVDISLKKLLKQPSPEAEVALEFPIDVNVTGISKDQKWYRVHISYDLVFFGKYNYEGWVNADVFKYIGKVTPETISY